MNQIRQRASRFFGQRVESDKSEQECWLSIYNGAVASGKTPEDAIAAADAGTLAMRGRFAARRIATGGAEG